MCIGMKASQNQKVSALALAEKLRKRLIENLGEPLELILFGSQARGDAKKNRMWTYWYWSPNWKKKPWTLF